MRETPPDRLFTGEFVVLNAIFFLAAAVMALFFQFQHYLKSLQINPAWFGFLIGADSLASFVLQPVLAVKLHRGNARRWLVIGISGMAAALVCYYFALNPVSLVAVRIFHGAAFVCLISAMMAMMVTCIPPEKSGQAFGLVSVVRLLPYSIVPPVVALFGDSPADFRQILLFGALVMILTTGAALRLKSSTEASLNQLASANNAAAGGMLTGLRNGKVVVLLAVHLLLYSSYTVIFFFVREYAHGKGLENPGFFFTIATAAMIGVRVAGGPFFDRVDKVIVTEACMVGLAICYTLLAHASSPGMFYLLACLVGLGWGITMPVLAALVFDFSERTARGMNLNLSLVMMQGGFFIGPFLGGLLLTRWGYGILFYFCALAALLAASLLHTIPKRRLG
jgi:MFS family permease